MSEIKPCAYCGLLSGSSAPPASVREVLEALPTSKGAESINDDLSDNEGFRLGSIDALRDRLERGRALLERLEVGDSERVKELEAELAEARNTPNPEHLEHVQKIARVAQELEDAIEALSVSSALERVGFHFLERKVQSIAWAADQILGKRKAGDPDA